MLVIFKTKAYANITMFGEVATELLKLMGHSGTVPSALLAEDVPEALERLRSGLAARPPDSADAEQHDPSQEAGEPPVGLAQRAFPLIRLLEAAAREKADVTWTSS